MKILGNENSVALSRSDILGLLLKPHHEWEVSGGAACGTDRLVGIRLPLGFQSLASLLGTEEGRVPRQGYYHIKGCKKGPKTAVKHP